MISEEGESPARETRVRLGAELLQALVARGVDLHGLAVHRLHRSHHPDPGVPEHLGTILLRQPPGYSPRTEDDLPYDYLSVRWTRGSVSAVPYSTVSVGQAPPLPEMYVDLDCPWGLGRLCDIARDRQVLSWVLEDEARTPELRLSASLSLALRLASYLVMELKEGRKFLNDARHC